MSVNDCRAFSPSHLTSNSDMKWMVEYDLKYGTGHQHDIRHRGAQTTIDPQVATRNLLQSLRKALLNLKTDVTHAIGTIIDVVDLMGGGDPELNTVEVGTSTEVLKSDKASLHVPATKDAVTNTELGSSSMMQEVGEHELSLTSDAEPMTISRKFGVKESSCFSDFSSPYKPTRSRSSVIGTGRCHGRLSAYSTRRELFISNVDPRATVSDVLVFLRSKVTVLKIRQISHPNARSKSFFVEVPHGEVDYAMCPQFWPRSIRCREFVRPLEGLLAAI